MDPTGGDASIFVNPVPPELTSVGDGLVPLASTISSPPTTVTLQGNNFASGATVIADIDGVQTPLPASSVSSDQLNVSLAASVFGIRTYTFSLLLQQNANQGQHPLQAHQQVISHQVYFGNQTKYGGPPSGNSQVFNLGGFHKRNTQKNNHAHPPDYFLMVPSNGSNSAIAYVPAETIPAGANNKISFDPDQPALAAPTPPTTTQAVQAESDRTR